MTQSVGELEEFVSSYLQFGEEGPTHFKIEQKKIDDSISLTPFLECIKKLHQSIPESDIYLNCELKHAETGFSLIANVDIENLSVVIQEFTIESEVEICNAFENAELADNLQKFRNDHISHRLLTLDRLTSLIKCSISSGEITDIKFSFSFDKKGILSKISHVDLNEVKVFFFLSFENFSKYIQQTSFFNLRNSLLSNKEGTLILVLNSPSNCFGDYFGLCDLEGGISNKQILENFLKNMRRDIQRRSSQIVKTISSHGLDFFLPPQYFNFVTYSGCSTSVKCLFYPLLLFNIFISFSDFVEKAGDNSCKLSISGTRIVASSIKIENDYINKIQLDGVFVDYLTYSEKLDELYTYYSKIFGTMDTGELDETKIFLSKKIISTYSRTYLDFITHIHDIVNSTQSDYKLYVQERIDKFINFKEQLINYTFNQNKDIVKFNYNLNETLGDNFFKIIGYILVFSIGLVAEVDSQLGEIYLIFGPLLLIGYVILSIYQLRNIKLLYDKNQEYSKTYIQYFERYLEKSEIENFSKEIDSSIFDKEYGKSIAILIVTIIICLLVWIYLNKELFLDLGILQFGNSTPVIEWLFATSNR